MVPTSRQLCAASTTLHHAATRCNAPQHTLTSVYRTLVLRYLCHTATRFCTTALNCAQSVPYVCKRALYVRKRAPSVYTSALSAAHEAYIADKECYISVGKRALWMCVQKSPVCLHKSLQSPICCKRSVDGARERRTSIRKAPEACVCSRETPVCS